MDLLLDLKTEGKLDLNDIREEVDTFMFEGHDTSATSTMWTLYLLGRHPDIQEKARNEVNTHWGSAEILPAEDLSSLKYLECCLKESLRLYPSVPQVMRILDTPVKLDENYTIPAKSWVHMPIVQLHRDPEQWPEPDKFDPDRFQPEVAALRHPYAYLPFSAGSRNCIGQRFALMEIKTIVAYLLRHFSWESVQAESEMKPGLQMVLVPTAGVHLAMKKLS